MKRFQNSVVLASFLAIFAYCRYFYKVWLIHLLIYEITQPLNSVILFYFHIKSPVGQDSKPFKRRQKKTIWADCPHTSSVCHCRYLTDML